LRAIRRSRVLEHGGVDAHSSTSDIRILKILQIWSKTKLLHRQLGVAVGSMGAVVLETVEVLVSLAANLTAVWLLFLHADSSRVGNGCERVDNRKGTVVVLLELLVLVTVLLVVLETVLVLVCLLATNDWAPEWLDLLGEGELGYACAVDELLLP